LNLEDSGVELVIKTKVSFINYILLACTGLAIVLSLIIPSTYAVMKTEVTTTTTRLRASDNFGPQMSPNEQVNSKEVPLGVNKNGKVVQNSSVSRDNTVPDLRQEPVTVQGVQDKMEKTELNSSENMGSGH
jgi:hypothetical protein